MDSRAEGTQITSRDNKISPTAAEMPHDCGNMALSEWPMLVKGLIEKRMVCS